MDNLEYFNVKCDFFWQIIERSKEISCNFDQQISVLIEELSQFSEEDIINFEYKFREILSNSSHYNILAAAKIIEGYVSDDSFLYFRCRLIAEGEGFYYNTIRNPESIVKNGIVITEFWKGEEMLVVADQAFTQKFGEDTEKELPRDVAFEYLNYNEGEEIIGVDWKEEELPKKYPQLWKAYM